MAFPGRGVELKTGKGLGFRAGDLGQVPSVKWTQSPVVQIVEGGGPTEVPVVGGTAQVCEWTGL